MNDLKNDEFAGPEPGSGGQQAVVVIVTMRPDRIGGGLAEGDGCAEAPIRKTYRTGSWYFASDLLDRMAEISARECPGVRLRPAQVEITFALDDKAYRQVGLVLDSFDRAYRAL